MMSNLSATGKTILYIADASELEAADLLQLARDAVDRERLRRTEKYAMEQDRRLSLTAGILFRQALRDFGAVPEQVCLQTGKKGKPELENVPGLYFNLSHSGDRAICAMSTGRIGCDIEKVDYKRDVQNIASRHFSPSEKAWLNGFAKGERTDAFYRLWTLKESFLKNLGIGLTIPLDSFSVSIGEKGACVEQNLSADSFCLFELTIEGGYHAACCISAGPAPEVRFVKLNDILNKEN